MIKVSISNEIAKACPDLRILVVSCRLQNTASDKQLWQEIAGLENEIRSTCKIEEINKWQPIRATRQAYKSLGKDPNRYRPSAESLRRRILRDLPLYKIDTLVDIVNLVSLRSGYSIGGFDASKIDGELLLGVGREGEVYRGIGRGELNIEGLPVYRDRIGGVGTPTSDEERTKIDMATTDLLMIINCYSGEAGLVDTGQYAATLLRKYVSATNIKSELVSPENRVEITL